MFEQYMIQELKKQTLLTEKLEDELKEMAKRNNEIQLQVQNTKISRRTKSVHFADDCGFLLARNFNIPTVEPRVKKLSKVSNFLHTECRDNDELYLESTLSNRMAVFGTVISNKSDLKSEELKIIYTWDNNKHSQSTTPYFLGSNKKERFLFKIPAPRRTRQQKDENKTFTVKFHLEYEGKRLLINNGEDFVAEWSGR